MITYIKGNLLESPAEALVNAVNTHGVMGKGIALMFKKAFPANFKAYAVACKKGEVTVGKMFVTQLPATNGPRCIINFPTKKHWVHPSKLEYVTDGLTDMVRVIKEYELRSLAVPPLGCGAGGLKWEAVKPCIEEALGNLQGVEVMVYEPAF